MSPSVRHKHVMTCNIYPVYCLIQLVSDLDCIPKCQMFSGLKLHDKYIECSKNLRIIGERWHYMCNSVRYSMFIGGKMECVKPTASFTYMIYLEIILQRKILFFVCLLQKIFRPIKLFF